MKTTYRYIAAAFAAIAAVACAKQEISEPDQDQAQVNTYEYVLNVSQEDTKTTMDGLSILWSKEDQIAVSCTFDGGYKTAKASGGAQSIADFENYTPSTSATFNLQLTEGYSPLVASYPYSDDIRCTSGGSLSGRAVQGLIPAVQTGVLGNIPAGSLSMVGDIKNGECQMYNVGAVIKFEITYDDITSLKFEGNNSEIVSGLRFYYTASGNFAKEADNLGETSVTLVPSGKVFEPGEYYFVVSPNALTEGFTITLTNSFGQKASRKSTANFTIERNNKYTKFGSDKGWFGIVTGAAGNVGSVDGTTATLYGIAPDALKEGDIFGFQTSPDGETWTDFNGTINKRFFTAVSKSGNIYTADLTGLTPNSELYYRAVYSSANGLTSYGKVHSFRTYSGATSVVIDFYNGWENWPFINVPYNGDTPQTENIGINKGTGDDALWKDTPLTLQLYDKLTFEAKAVQGVWIGRSGCLTMKVADGDYFRFPVIPGKKPVSVTLVSPRLQTETDPASTNNTMGSPSIRKVGAESNVEGGDIAPKPTTANHIQTWRLSGTEASGQYEMHFNSRSALNCYMSYFEVVYVDDNSDTRQPLITQDLVFCEGEGDHNKGATITQVWPFVQTRTSWKSGPFPATEYNTAINPDLKYSFNVQTYGDSNWKHTRAGLIYGGTKGDYMAILPVADYKITCIEIRSGKKATKYSVTDKDGNVTPGGAEQTMKASYDARIKFDLTETSPNTEYHLELGDTNVANIREMWITYELVK